MTDALKVAVWLCMRLFAMPCFFVRSSLSRNRSWKCSLQCWPIRRLPQPRAGTAISKNTRIVKTVCVLNLSPYFSLTMASSLRQLTWLPSHAPRSTEHIYRFGLRFHCLRQSSDLSIVENCYFRVKCSQWLILTSKWSATGKICGARKYARAGTSWSGWRPPPGSITSICEISKEED